MRSHMQVREGLGMDLGLARGDALQRYPAVA